MSNFDQLGVGLGPVPLGPQAGSLIAFPLSFYETPLLDLTIPHLDIELVPAKPGHFPILLNPAWLLKTRTGTQTNGATVRAGNNEAHDNFIRVSPDAPNNFSINLATQPSLGIISPAPAAFNIARIANATVLFDVVTGATGTGGFTLMAKLNVLVMWAPLGGTS